MGGDLIAALLLGLGTGAAGMAMQRQRNRLLWRRVRQEAEAAERGQHIVLEPLPAEPEAAAGMAAVRRLTNQLGQTDADLRGERDRLAAVLAALADGVLALDPEGRVLLANPSVERILGLNQSPVGKKLLDLLRYPTVQDAWQLLRRSGKISEPAEIALEDGREVVVAVRPVTTLVAETEGASLAGELGAVIVVRDVTALRRLERVRRDFIANASHELRTPVATVRASAELLLDGAIDIREDAVGFSETILRNAERLSAILNDLLDLSRIEAGVYDLRTEPTAVLGRLQRAAQLAEPHSKQREQTVLVDAPVGLRVRANTAALDQVLQNLVDNASKYSGNQSTLVLSAAEEGTRVVLTVSDNGPGIPLQHRQRIFERFYRLDSGRSRELGGTGLGLAIVKHLVEGMGGRISCHANQPKGTQFRVDLPGTGNAP
jgi:two-component system phosphate regulon sensor histidine kinase PhoR